MASDLYEILGVEPEADFELIKRQYRVLVRANHPDIAADKDTAHARMQEILRAWSVLSDPAERARYDRIRRGKAAPAPTPAAPAKPSAPGHTDGWASNIPSEAVRKARIAQNFQQARAPHHSSNPRTRLLTMVFEAAQLYYEGHMAEAVDICTKVMRSDPTNAEAPALLGDIYGEQGRKDVALLMYERAMRNQPGNLLYRQKWQALKNGAAAPRPNQDVQRPPAAPAAVPVNGNQAHGNGAAKGGGNGVAPAEPVAAATAPTGAGDAARGSIKSKLTGWMGRRK